MELAAEMEAALDTAIQRSQEYLFSRQKPDGHWVEEVEANMDLSAEYIMMMQMFRLVDEQRQEKVCRYILDSQKENGSWPLHASGPGNLSTTIECYVALKMAGHDTGEEYMCRARDFILENGGLSCARAFTRIHLALMGLFSWEGVPRLPVWLVMIPPGFRFNIYGMSSWARGCVVPLCILLHLKKEYPPEQEIDLDELYVEGEENVDHSFEFTPGDTAGNCFILADRVLRKMEKRSIIPLEKRALARAERWILDHQEVDGAWGAIIPAMAYSVMALVALGYPLEDPVVKKGIEAIDALGIDDGDQWRLQPCTSPVWDTALTTWAMNESGVTPDDSRLVKAAGWLLPRQIRRYGDWAVKNRSGRPGGWCFEYCNDLYPDTDDTAAVILAISGVDMGPAEKEKEQAIRKGREWVLSMQGKSGGWAAFDVDNNLGLMNSIPFADHGAMLDPDAVDLSGKILEMLSGQGYSADSEPGRRCIEFLKKQQEPEGSWFGRWGVNHLYGTCGVLSGLSSIGEDMSAPYVRRAVNWIIDHQNQDGGWGETPDSYVDRSLRGRGESTPSQTAWALLALVSAGEAGSQAAVRGVDYLLSTQHPSGRWDEEEFTGTGFPGSYYLKYHGYRNCFPLMALGRFRRVAAGTC